MCENNTSLTYLCKNVQKQHLSNIIYVTYLYMKIPNYDTNKNGKQNRKLNNLFNEDHRMLITAQSKCGKTNTLMHMLRTPLFYYDKIYLYSPNQHQDKIQDLEKIMDKIYDKVGYPVYWKLDQLMISKILQCVS